MGGGADPVRQPLRDNTEKDLKRRREGDEATRQPRPPRRRCPFIWVRNYAGGDVFQVAPLAMNVKKGDQGEAEQRLYG